MLLVGSMSLFVSNLILNGGFEKNTPINGWLTFSYNSHQLKNWKIEKGSIDLVGNYWQSSEGRNSIDLCGSSRGIISQTINTIPNEEYILKFDLSGNPDNQGVKYLKVKVNNDTKIFTFDTRGKNKHQMGWVTKTIRFKANSYNTKITFIAMDKNPYVFGPVIDNVRVERVGNTLSKRFNYPKIDNFRLDWCKYWATECGKPAADEFCKRKGYSSAISFKADSDIGLQSTTKVIGTGQLCSDSFCDGFKYIECESNSKPKNETINVNKCGLYSENIAYAPDYVPSYFPSNTKKILFSCEISNVKSNIRIDGVWYYVKPNGDTILITSYPFNINKDYNGYFTFYLESAPGKNWPIGRYKVVLMQNHKVLKELYFNIR